MTATESESAAAAVSASGTAAVTAMAPALAAAVSASGTAAVTAMAPALAAAVSARVIDGLAMIRTSSVDDNTEAESVTQMDGVPE